MSQDSPSATRSDYQVRIEAFMFACFGREIADDVRERNHRFIEEALELVQATGCTAADAHMLVDYVFGRPTGEAHQETGGVMVTLAALCNAVGLCMEQAGEDELSRVWGKIDVIREKQRNKPRNSPLPQSIAVSAIRDISNTIKQAEAMAATGASATHIIELFRATNAAPQEITVEASSPVLGEVGKVQQSEGAHTHPVPTREAEAACGAAPSETPRQPSTQWKFWREARPMELEPYYCYWVSHLTSEGLHDKADIATVLAILHQQRDDMQQDALRLHREKMEALFGPDGRPKSNLSATKPAIQAGYMLVEVSRIEKLCIGIRRAVEAGHLDARSMAADAGLLLEAMLQAERSSTRGNK